MNFLTLVEEIRHLSLSEKEEMRSLLDRYVAEERRAQMPAHHRESLEELQRGEHQRSLRGLLAASRKHRIPMEEWDERRRQAWPDAARAEWASDRESE